MNPPPPPSLPRGLNHDIFTGSYTHTRDGRGTHPKGHLSLGTESMHVEHILTKEGAGGGGGGGVHLPMGLCMYL